MGAIDWESVAPEIKLASSNNDMQVCENGVYHETRTKLVEKMPTGVEDSSLEDLKSLHPREFYTLFPSINANPFSTMTIIRWKIGFDFDEIFVGRAKSKSPYSLTKHFICPGYLMGQYLSAFSDTDPKQVMVLKVAYILSDLGMWATFLTNPRACITLGIYNVF